MPPTALHILVVLVTLAAAPLTKAADAPPTRAASEANLKSLLAAALAGDRSREAKLRQVLEVRKARALAASGDRRRALAVELADTYARLAERSAGCESAVEILQHFRDRLTRVEAIGLIQAGEYAERVLWLQAGPSERMRLDTLARRALGLGDALIADIDRRRTRLGSDLEMLAVGAPERLDRLGRFARYKGAWIRLYLAVALQADPTDKRDPVARRRKALLTSVLETVPRYIADGPDREVEFGAMLLGAMAASELGSWDKAGQWLAALGQSESAPAALRLQAIFERAKLAARRGRWRAAGQWLAMYRADGRDGLSPADRARRDLRAAFGHDWLYTREAAATADLAAAKLRIEAGAAYAACLEQYPAYRKAMAERIARRYAEVKDISDLNGAIALAKGLAIRDADPAGAVRYFSAASDDAQRSSPAIGALAVWHLAGVLYAQGRDGPDGGWPSRLASARAYRRMVEQFGADAQADLAARNALTILQERLRALRDVGRVDDEVRTELVQTIEVYLKNSPDAADAPERRYQLAGHLESLGRTAEAIEHYRRIAPDAKPYPSAQGRALMLECGQLRLTEAPLAQRQRRARTLVMDLTRYIRSIQQWRGECEDADCRRELTELGVRADLAISQLLADPLGRLDDALANAAALDSRWGAGGDWRARAQAFRVSALLSLGRTLEAVEAMGALQAADAASADALAGDVAAQLRRTLRQLSGETESSAALVRLYQVYGRFAEQARAAAVAGGASKESIYLCEQMLAEARAETGRVAEAKTLFGRLSAQRPDDAANLIGLARCHRLSGEFAPAVRLYRRVLAGVDRQAHGELWWRTQLDLARCLYEAVADDSAQLTRLGVRLEQLRLQDADFGGMAAAFESVRARIARRLNDSPKAGLTQD